MEAALTGNNLQIKVTNRQILSIALPITFAILIPQLNLLTNNIFLGHFSEQSLGNAGITSVYFLIFAVSGNGLNNAVQSVLSRYAGAGKTEMLATVMMQSVRICLQYAAICILFTWLATPYILKQLLNLADYEIQISFIKIIIFTLPFLYLFQAGNAFLVATLNSRFMFIGFVLQAACNIALDYGFIFGKLGLPALGFNGAAVATVISEVLACIVLFFVLYKTGLLKKYSLFRNYKYDKKITREVRKMALPLVLQYMISVTTWLVFFILIETQGTVAKAVSNVMRNVYGIAGIFVWAFGSTCNTMVSNLIGQHKFQDVIPAVNKITLWSAGISFSIGLLLNLHPEFFFNLFGQGASFAAAGTPVIRVVTIGIFFLSIANVWLNAVTGTGKTKINLLIEIIAIIIYMTYTWYFMKVNYISLTVAWTNEFIYWLTTFGMAFWFMKSKRWIDKE